MIKFNFQNGPVIWLVGLLLFLLMYPLISQVNFMQNDDWVYYKTIENFLNGNFYLAEKVGITFYTQGILGYIFASIFGIINLPILTLSISVGNFLMVGAICKNIYKLSVTTSLLLSSLLFFNPLHFYSSLGFMSENFVLFFILLGVYFVNRFLATSLFPFFIFLNFSLILGFFSKQYLIVAFVSIAIILFVQKLYKYFLFEVLIICLLVFYYLFLFPATEVFRGQNIQISNLFNISNLYSLTFVSFIYLSAMLAPLVYFFVFQKIKSKSYLVIAIAFFISLMLSFLIKLLFSFTDYSIRVFPYIGNTFDRRGFFPGDLLGNKYSWRGVFDVFKFWNFFSLFGFSAFLFTVCLEFRKNFINKFIKYLDFELLFFILYFGLFVVSWNTYDRYLLPLIAVGILLFAKNIQTAPALVLNSVLFLFVSFLIIINVQLSLDYVSWQNYVWKKSAQMSRDLNISENEINSSRAWNKYYGSSDAYKFEFTFDSPEVLDNRSYELVETADFSNPTNLFVNPKVYLYSIRYE